MFTLNSRSVDLVDKDGNQRTNQNGAKLKALGVEVKAVDLGDRTIRMIASTEDVDRHGDIIRAEGWQLDAYRKNPVILWGHDHTTPAIATAKRTWVEDGKLLQDWYFPTDYKSELSQTVYSGYKEGIFKASSVGFAPLIAKPLDEDMGPFGPMEFTSQELFEVSAVNVPANPEALMVMQAKGIDTRSIEEMWQHLEGFVLNVADDRTHVVDDATDVVDKATEVVDVEPDTEPDTVSTCGWCDDEGWILLDEDDDEEMAFCSCEIGEKMAEENIDDSLEFLATVRDADEPLFVMAEDYNTMKLILEDQGYEVELSEEYKAIWEGIKKNADLITFEEEKAILTLDEDDDVLELEPEPGGEDISGLLSPDVVEELRNRMNKKLSLRQKVKQAVGKAIFNKFGILEDK